MKHQQEFLLNMISSNSNKKIERGI